MSLAGLDGDASQLSFYVREFLGEKRTKGPQDVI